MWVYAVVVLLVAGFIWAVTRATPKSNAQIQAEAAAAKAADDAAREADRKRAAHKLKVDVTAKFHHAKEPEHEHDQKLDLSHAKDQFRGHSAEVTAVAFAPNGQWMASASRDRTLRLWKLSPDGAAAGPDAGHSKVYARLNVATDHIRWLGVSADSKYIACLTDFTRSVQFYGVPAGAGAKAEARIQPPRLLHEFSVADEHKASPKGFGFASNASFVLTAGDGDTVVSVYSAKGTLLQAIDTHQMANHCTAVSGDGAFFAIGTQMANARLYRVTLARGSTTDVDVIQNVANLTDHKRAVTAVAFGSLPAPDRARVVLTGTGDGVIRAYGLDVRFDAKEDPPLRRQIDTALPAVDHIALSPAPDATPCFVVVSGAALHVFSLVTWERLCTVEPHGSGAGVAVRQIAFSADGKTLATIGGGQHVIKHFDVLKLMGARPAPPTAAGAGAGAAAAAAN